MYQSTLGFKVRSSSSATCLVPRAPKMRRLQSGLGVRQLLLNIYPNFCWAFMGRCLQYIHAKPELSQCHYNHGSASKYILGYLTIWLRCFSDAWGTFPQTPILWQQVSTEKSMQLAKCGWTINQPNTQPSHHVHSAPHFKRFIPRLNF